MNSDLVWGQSSISRAKQTFMSIFARVADRPLKNGIVPYFETKLCVTHWAEKGRALSHISMRIKIVFKMSVESMNERAFYMKIYSNLIASPVLLCDQWADRIRLFSLVEVLPLARRYWKTRDWGNWENNPAWLTHGKDSQDTADGTPSTTSSNITPPREKKKRKGCKNTDSNGKTKTWLEKV